MPNRMSKADMVKALSERHGLAKAAVDRLVDDVCDIIQREVAGGNEVALGRLGVFCAASRAARTGKNPKTGEAIAIPAKRVPKFKAGKLFRDALE